MQKLTPFLWFNDQAEEAAKYYVSIFDNSKFIGVTRYGDTGPGPAGSVMTASFVLRGQEFTALNGGPQFSFTPAISFVVYCEDQAEIDRYWEKLSEGGRKVECGWLTDKYGLSWQIVPTLVMKLLAEGDDAKTERVMKKIMQMQKLEIAPLKEAYEQVG